MNYKWCAVPKCTNTSIKTPEKLFLCVPKKGNRKKWLQLARRNPNDVIETSTIFFCEDHFNLEKDVANYRQYKMGFSQRLLLVDGVLPSKFHCQQDCQRRIYDTDASQSAIGKWQNNQLIKESNDNILPTATVLLHSPILLDTMSETVMTTESQQTSEERTSTEPVVAAEKSDLNLPKEPSSQNQGLKNRGMDHLNSMLRVCRICFGTDDMLFSLSESETMSEAYETFTGCSLVDEPQALHYVCIECARRLLHCARFRSRVLRARDKLLESFRDSKRVTLITIKKLQNEFKENEVDGQIDRNIDSSMRSLAEKAKIHRATQTDTHNMNVLGEDANSVKIKMEFDDSVNEDSLNHTLDEDFGCIPSCFDAVYAVKVEADEIINHNLPTSANKTNYTSLDENVDKIKTEWNDINTTMSHNAKDTSIDAVDVTSTLPSDISVPDIKIEEGLTVRDAGNNTLHNVKAKKRAYCFMGSETDDRLSLAEMRSTGADAASGVAEETNKTTGTAVRNQHADVQNNPYLYKDSYKTYTEEDNDVYSIDISDICRDTVLTKRELDEHIELTHSAGVSSGEGFNKKFKKKENLTTRIAKRSVQKQFLCEICSETFSKKSSLKLHLSEHSGEKIFSCGICNEEFERKENFTAHLQVHSGVRPFSCDICKKTFSTQSSLNAHIKRHSDKKLFSCDVCEKTFSTKSILRTHVRIVHSNITYSCEICKKEYKKEENFKAHSKTHSGEKPFPCGICSKTFITKGTLNVHLRKHTGDKPYSCDICNKAFYRSDDLKQHTSIHSGDKPFACDVCNIAFNKRNNLKMHMRIHSGEKPYSCDVCNKKFNRKDGVKKHLASHFGLKPYKCDLCNKTFHRKDCLVSHLRVHFGKKLYCCDICNKTFGQKFYFQKHLRSHSDT